MFFLKDDKQQPKRFDMIKFFNFDADNIESLTSFFGYAIPRLPEIGTRTVIQEEKRPDLLSYNIYNDTQYWWILLWYNNILNVNELTAGMEIRYPALNAIEELYMMASTLKKTSSD